MSASPVLARLPLDAALLLVSDPDGLLNDEHLLAELRARGYTVLAETDPVRLRYCYSHSAPPHLVVTAGPLERLPYDLWQKGVHVTLALHEFFPNLAYPLLQALPPEARARLFQAPQPARRLGQAATLDYLFRHVFDLDLNALGNPLTFIEWLSQRERPSLPAPFRAALRARLAAEEAYHGWPLDDLLEHPERLGGFLQEQFQAYLAQRGWLRVQEAHPAYLDFGQPAWQDALPRWLRAGLLTPLVLESIPVGSDWLVPLVHLRPQDSRLERLRQGLASLEERLEADPPRDFAAWSGIAAAWGELTALRYADDLPADLEQACLSLQTRLDDLFPAWLQSAYPALAVQALPEPHHLFHVPHYLAALRRQGRAGRVALLILDGLSLADWQVLWEGWRARRRWESRLRLLLAQIPTITAISRQALVSGRRPQEFASSITHNREEEHHWSRFWSEQGLGQHACRYARFPAELHALDDVQALCLVVTDIDKLHHHALLGPQAAQASLRHWRDHQAAALEATIETLLQMGFSLWLTSDHGNVPAYGIGQPREGVIVETRGLRARTYQDEHLARLVQQEYPETTLWHGDGLLPANLWALLPHGRMAFAPKDEIHIAHGGLTLEEVFVPFVHLLPASAGELD